MILTAHQPNFCPAVTTLSKLNAARCVLWLDAVPFSKGGYTNRVRLSDGSWLTVPVCHGPRGQLIREVLIDDSRPWRRKMVRRISERYGSWGLPAVVCRAVDTHHVRLVDLNLAILKEIVAPEQFLQSDLPALRGILDPSERIARAAYELGCDTYLAGPSAHAYLNLAPFKARAIAVDFWPEATSHPSILDADALV
jgi:hypothetical protein